MFETRLFGQFDIRRNGNPISIPSRPAQSLLAYLLLHPKVKHRREVLAGLLFPDSSEENARSGLRHALWRIRKALDSEPGEPPLLAVDELSIAFLPPANLKQDTLILEQKSKTAATREELISQVEVYTGDLLPGFYDDWIVLERERLRAIFHQKMKLLLDGLSQQQAWEELLEWAEHWLALGQTPEPAYAALMLAHAHQGDLASMAAVYRRCRDALSAELGVEPSEHTQALFEKLSRGEWPAPGPAIFLPENSPASEETAGSPAPGEPPYKGLQYFDLADSEFFFGREALISRLAERLREHHFLAVLGSSGSGKSSVLRAGLIPALKSGLPLANGALPPQGCCDWPVVLMTPTANPLQALAASLNQVTGSPGKFSAEQLANNPDALRAAAREMAAGLGVDQASPSYLLVIVDQFEELFSLCQDEAERRSFIDHLMAAAANGGAARVVIALRADFYAQCARYAGLRQEMADHQEYIGEMSPAELRRAIEEPARLGGWKFEPGLVDFLLRDISSEPGALPLLSHALLETWKRRRGRTLCLASYTESGRVSGAIAQTAESTFQRFHPEQQRLARLIFLRLTQLGEGVPNTHRCVALGELQSLAKDPELVHTVLRELASARLIVIDEGSVEVAHEALIREWPTLRRWLAEDREGLRLHRRLTEEAQKWEQLEHDPDELLRGGRLVQALEWSQVHSQALNELEFAFLEASRLRAEGEAAEREAQRVRELETAQKIAQTEMAHALESRRTAQQLRRRAVFLTIAFFLAILMTLAALYFGGIARQSAQEAGQSRRIAISRELAAAALNLIPKDPELSVLLAEQAISVTYDSDQTWTLEAENALHAALQNSHLEFMVGSATSPMYAAAYRPDGRAFATTSEDGAIRIWDALTGRQLQSFPTWTHRGWHDLAFSPDGNLLAAGGQNGLITIWDAGTGKLRQTLKAQVQPIMALDFSPDGSQLLSASLDATAILWDSQTGASLYTLKDMPDDLLSAAFSPDGARVATGDHVGVIRVWDARTGQLVLKFGREPAPQETTAAINGIAFSPDGKLLASAGDDRVVRIWNAASGHEEMALHGHNGAVTDVAFLPDQTRLASSSSDGSILVWNLQTGQPGIPLRGHSDTVVSLDVSPDGAHLVSTSLDGTARVWSSASQREWLTLPAAGNAARAVYRPDGSQLAAGFEGSQVRIWDAVNGQVLWTLSGHTGPVTALAYSPQGSTLASGSADRTIRIWDARNGQPLQTLNTNQGGIIDLVFSPDGSLLASAGKDKTIRLWDLSTTKSYALIQEKSVELACLAFSPDGKKLAAATADGVTRIWTLTQQPELGWDAHQILELPAQNSSVASLAFRPGGSQLATANSNGSVYFWNLADGSLAQTLSGHTAGVTSLAFSPDGMRLAFTSSDGSLKIWDPSIGRELLSLEINSEPGSKNGVAFEPMGDRLAVSTSQFIGIYLTRVQDLASLAVQRVNRTLSSSECERYLHQSNCPLPGRLFQR